MAETAVVPGCQYRLQVFIAFIHALLGGDTVEQAYLKAIGFPPKDPRHAWRWLQRFLKQLSRWRTGLFLKTETIKVTQRSSTLQIVLPTLQALIDRLGDLNRFQTQYQQALC